jgi:hypothetical protein
MSSRFHKLALAAFALAFAAAASHAAEIRLKDGAVVRGEVVSQNDSIVEVRSETLGLVRISRDRIASGLSPMRSAAGPNAASADPDPISHALVLMPTAFLPEKRTVVFRDFELLFLTLGWSPTASTSVVAGALFPVSTEFNALTVGVKQGLFLSRDGATAVAAAGNITVPIGSEINNAGYIWLLNLVASHRFAPWLGLHGAVGGVGAEGRDAGVRSLSLAAGTDIRLTRNVKFLGEVLRGGTSIDPGSSLTLINAGFRLHGDRLSADLCAMRPVTGNLGDLWVIPLINVGYRF